MRTFLVLLTIVLATPVIGLAVIIASLLGIPDRPGSLFDRAPRLWGSLLVRAGGVRVVVHDAARMQTGEPRVYAANHVSWFDVFVLASTLRRYKFIAKAELERIPLFGAAVRAAGFIFIDRSNRTAAFAGYEAAAARMRRGFSVVVYPEGTRGTNYALRPFKKGPFVLAIAAGAPVVPTLLYGTREVSPNGSFAVTSATVHVHFLEPVPTEGLTYGDRDRVARLAFDRMAAALEQHYGVCCASPPSEAESLETEPAPA